MPRKKAAPAPDPSTAPAQHLVVLLEEIRAQNRATIEAVWSTRDELRREFNERFRELTDRIDRVESTLGARIDALTRRVEIVEQALLDLSAVVRRNSDDIRRNSDDIRRNSDDIRRNSDDIAALRVEIEKLARVVATKPDAERVAALEARIGALESTPTH